MIPGTVPQMPMAAALQSTLPMPPLTDSAAQPAQGLPMPPPAAAPPAAQGPQWTVRQQSDGSSVYVMPGPLGDGSDDIIVGINPPPKLGKHLQAAQAPQGVPPAFQPPPPVQ